MIFPDDCFSRTMAYNLTSLDKRLMDTPDKNFTYTENPIDRDAFQHKHGIIGRSMEIREVVDILMQVAPTDITVLITGESGTGKEVIARALHSASARSQKKMVSVNCGAIPEGILESELFGHEKGSFTGAVESRKGYFEIANGGTIFLDEIGEMPISTQVKLLRVLENGEFFRVEGREIHEVAVGPVHAGIIEPGHFRFSVVGERVLRLEQHLGYKHKGIEKRFERIAPLEGHRLAGRVSGDSTVAYAWAYCMALESVAACEVSPRAAWLRALLLERERVANHLGDLGALGNDAALGFGLAQFSRLREDWQRLNRELFGHRFMMDRVVPGGVAVDLDGAAGERLRRQCDAIEADVRTLMGIYEEHAGLQDRFLTTGRVLPKLARQLGLCGVAGRASGQASDLRMDFPWAPYDALRATMATHRNGDVAARVLVRFEEIFESLRLIREIVLRLPAGTPLVVLNPLPAHGIGAGWVEGWRGDVLVALEFEAGGIRRCHCHDPSWQNWPLLEHAVMDNIVPDFPVINKSFNLSYSGQDL